jgi:superfamily II DNA or RNA helicase
VPDDVELVVVDEAHRVAAESYQNMLAACPHALVLGLTASPWRLDGAPLGDTFNSMVVMAEAVELIELGYLAQPICYGIPKDKALALTKGLRAGVDFAQGDLGRVMTSRPLMGDILSEWLRHAEGLPTIVFAVNHEHAQALYGRFKAAKVATAYLRDGIPDAERDSVLDHLKDGKTTVVVNVDMLSEGYDCPSVQCVVMARPTKSLTRFLQQCGRGSRPHGKCIILDHAGNCWRFGFPETPRPWSLTRAVPREKSEGAPCKLCVNEDCRMYMPTGCHECPDCGTDQPFVVRGAEARGVQLERLIYTAQQRDRVREVLDQILKARPVAKDFVPKVLKAMGIES